MADLTVKIDDIVAYSDGKYMPTDDAGDMFNPIINTTKSSDCGVITLRAISDNGINGLFPNDDNEIQSLDSSYVVYCDCEWVRIIRERNIINIVYDRNYDSEVRIANITFQHNVEPDVLCIVRLKQCGEEYSIGTDYDEVTFTINGGEKTINVQCDGGDGVYFVHKIRKYTNFKYGDTENDKLIILKRVEFDNAINALINGEGNLVINCIGQIFSDDSYYEIVIEHANVIGLTKKIKVKFDNIDIATEIPPISADTEDQCQSPETVAPNITSPDDDGEVIVPSIQSRDNEIYINSTDYSDEIIVETVPMESKIYFSYYSSFIDDYIITDYIDENENITHGLKIKAKPNPFSIDRNCIGYIINAMYPQVRLKVIIHQGANT